MKNPIRLLNRNHRNRAIQWTRLWLAMSLIYGLCVACDDEQHPDTLPSATATAALEMSFSNHPTAESTSSSSLPAVEHIQIDVSGENIPEEGMGWTLETDGYSEYFEFLVPEGRNQILKAAAIDADGQVIKSIAAPVTTSQGTSISVRANIFTTPTAMVIERLAAPEIEEMYSFPASELQNAVHTIIGLDTTTGAYSALPSRINIDALEAAVRTSIAAADSVEAIAATDILTQVGEDILHPIDDSGVGVELDFGFPAISITASPASGYLPLEVTFNAVTSGFGGTVRQFKWDFDGDGQWDSLDQNPTHIFTTEEIFNTVIEVRDNTGALASTQIAINAFPRVIGTGRVGTALKISSTEGEFKSTLDNGDHFGSAVSALGDFDGDGINDLLSGARFDDDGGVNRGAVFIQLLNQDGTVKDYRKISAVEGNLLAQLDDSDHFGSAVTTLGDLDGDGIQDIVVGAPNDDDGGTDRGAIYVIFLTDDGQAKSYAKVSNLEGDFTQNLDNSDYFGFSLAPIGDLDEDGVPDLAVGAWGDDDGGPDRGAVYVLFLNRNGSVKDYRKISDTESGFYATIDNSDWFGHGLARMGDLNGDGVDELAVGAALDDDSGPDRGAVYILFLNRDGTVAAHQKISNAVGEFYPTFYNSERFGTSITGAGDINADGVPDLVVGASGDDDGGGDCGALYVLFLEESGEVKSHQKISKLQGKFFSPLDANDWFGHSVAAIGDINGDRIIDLAVGAFGDDDGGPDRGAVHVLFMD